MLGGLGRSPALARSLVASGAGLAGDGGNKVLVTFSPPFSGDPARTAARNSGARSLLKYRQCAFDPCQVSRLPFQAHALFQEPSGHVIGHAAGTEVDTGLSRGPKPCHGWC
eukprot:3660534-Pyramimonas_sp.AAC.1